jgi:hypothetical protein
MEDPLAVYLADHLAGSIHAIGLVTNVSNEYKDEPLGIFAREILSEIESDRQVLENLARRLGGGPSTIKEATAWAGEKLTRLKFHHGDKYGLGTFEALEHLSLGILGKLSLWRSLATAAPGEPRLQGEDYELLSQRARDQHAKVELKQLELARTVFRAEHA